MEMYREHYAVAVLLGGKVQKEVDNTVVLPFESEYVIRLKNKSRKRAVADVHIDGRIAVKGMIVNANGTVDLERFVIDNLNEGNRFKIVRKDDTRVDQPNEVENGNIEVRFYPERDTPEVKVVEHHTWHYNHSLGGHCVICCNDFYCPRCHPHHHRPLGQNSGVYYGAPLDSGSFKGMSAGDAMIGAQCSNSSSAAINTSSILRSAPLDMEGEDAATVEGSKSFQKFSTAYIDADYDKCVTLQLKLKGVTRIIEQCQCGFKRKDETYCPRCGNALAVGLVAQ